MEDEFLIALDLETDLCALGFNVCDLAANADRARYLAMSNQPDVVLMDVNLEGGREGIEAARWLRDVCQTAVVFVTSYNDDDTVERIHQQVPGAPVLAKPVYRKSLAGAVSAATKHCPPWLSTDEALERLALDPQCPGLLADKGRGRQKI